MTRHLLRALVLAWWLFPQQSSVGSISGTVTTASDGKWVPGTEILLDGSAAQKRVVSDAQGRFDIAGLAPGLYRVRAVLAGFLASARQVQVIAGQTATWNPVMRLFTARPVEPARGVDQTDTALARGVYTAVLQHVFKGTLPGAVDINSVSLVAEPLGDSEWPADMRDFPSDLLAAMTANPQGSAILRPESFPPAARLISTAQFGAPPSDRDGVMRPPRMALTRVFASTDGLNALVFGHFLCGSLCGN